MTPSEFKSWFEGFTEGLDGQPSKKQWERICKRVSEIDGTPVAPVYVERYRDWWRPYGAYVVNGVVPLSAGGALTTTSGGMPSSSAAASYYNCADPNVVPLFSGTGAWSMSAPDVMFAAGKEDAAEVASG